MDMTDMNGEQIAGTTYRREWPIEKDMQIAVVTNPAGPRLWCVGCPLTGHHEVIVTAEEMLSHIAAHPVFALQQAVDRHDAVGPEEGEAPPQTTHIDLTPDVRSGAHYSY